MNGNSSGMGVQESSPYAPQFTFIPNHPGLWSAQVIVTNDQTLSSTMLTPSFSVAQIAPILTVTGPSTTSIGVQNTFILAASYPSFDPNPGPINQWSVNWNDPNYQTVDTTSQLMLNHTYATPEVATIQVSGSDTFGTYSAASLTVDVVDPIEVTSLSATATTTGTINLLWRNDSNATGFNIEESADGGNSYSTIANDVLPSTVTPGIQIYSVGNLIRNTSYMFKVHSLDGGIGMDSNVAFATTADLNGYSANPIATFQIQLANPFVLQPGVHYELQVTGTGTFAPDVSPFTTGYAVDGQYLHQTPDPMPGFPGTPDLTSVINFGVSYVVQNESVTPYWGPYQSNHIYTVDVVGTGQPIIYTYKRPEGNFDQSVGAPITLKIFASNEPVTQLVADPSFEGDTVGTGIDVNPSGGERSVISGGWTLIVDSQQGQNSVSYAQIGNYNAIDGTQALHLGNAAAATQVINCPSAGQYNLSFWVAFDGNEGLTATVSSEPIGENIHVTFGNQTFAVPIPADGSNKWFHYNVPITVASAGTYTLLVGGSETANANNASPPLLYSAYVDNVTLTPGPSVTNSGFESASLNDWTISGAASQKLRASPEGDAMADLSGGSSIGQNVRNWFPGQYYVTYNAQQGATSTNQSVNVLVDGANVGTLSPGSKLGSAFSSVFPVSGDPNSHTLTFVAQNGEVLLDDIGIHPVPPAGPTKLSAFAVSSYKIDLSWTNPPTSPNGFTVLRADSDSFGTISRPFQVLAFNVPGTSTAYRDGTAQPGSYYAYQIIANTPQGPSAPSNYSVAQAPPVIPPSPAPPPGPPGYPGGPSLPGGNSSEQYYRVKLDESLIGDESGTTNSPDPAVHLTPQVGLAQNAVSAVYSPWVLAKSPADAIQKAISGSVTYANAMEADDPTIQAPAETDQWGSSNFIVQPDLSWNGTQWTGSIALRSQIDVSLNEPFDDTTFVATVQPLTAGITVDSTNQDGFTVPTAGSNAAIQDDPSLPGKLVQVDDHLTSSNVPDYAAGFTGNSNLGDGNSAATGVSFVPMVLTLGAGIDPSTATFSLNYSGSDPAGVTKTGTGSTAVYTPAAGDLRIWTKDGSAARNDGNFEQGTNPLQDTIGYYVAPTTGSQTYPAGDLQKLGFSDSVRTVTLWIEGIQATASGQSDEIKFTVYPNGSSSGPIAKDAARVTVYPGLIRTDANRDNHIMFGQSDLPSGATWNSSDSDRTSTNSPYQFWLNNNNDVVNQTTDTNTPDQWTFGTLTDSLHNQITATGDLQDWFPVVIHVPAGYNSNWQTDFSLTGPSPDMSLKAIFVTALQEQQYLTIESVAQSIVGPNGRFIYYGLGPNARTVDN